jgi:alcohol dehydrogenase
MSQLLPKVLDGLIKPGRVFDFQTDLDGIAEACAAMYERRAIKSLLKVS